jgi:hypothetical protein
LLWFLVALIREQAPGKQKARRTRLGPVSRSARLHGQRTWMTDLHEDESRFRFTTWVKL